MVTTEFYKAKAIEYLDAIKARKEIQPPTHIHELLTLGGVCFFLAHAVSPQDWKKADLAKLPKEAGEALETIRITESSGAIRYYATLVREIHKGTYDQQWDSHIQISIGVNEDTPIFKVISGKR